LIGYLKTEKRGRSCFVAREKTATYLYRSAASEKRA